MNLVLLHGALSSSECWENLKHQVGPELKNVKLHELDYDIAAKPAVDIVNDLYGRLLPRLSVAKTAFIGHSYGGILAIELARRLSSDRAFPVIADDISVLTLASPLGGSGAASLMKFFKPSSYLFRNVGSYDKFMLDFKSMELPCKTYSVITNSTDNSLLFGLSAFLPGANDTVVTVESQEKFNSDELHSHKYLECNHFDVLSSPVIGSMVKSLISDRPKFDAHFK